MAYHVNPKGEAGKCNAKNGKCPFGGPEEHYTSAEAARHAFEKSQSSFSSTRKDEVKSIPVLHGSSALFDSFSYDHIGGTGAEHGWGFYFTDSEEAVKYYGSGGFTYEIDFHARKPLSREKLNLSLEDMKKILSIMEEENPELLEDWGDVSYEGREKVVKRALDGMFYRGPGANDVDTLTNAFNDASPEAVKRTYAYLYEKYGFDSIPKKEDNGWDDAELFVATVPEAFDIVAVNGNFPRPNSSCSHLWEETLSGIKNPTKVYLKCRKCGGMETSERASWLTEENERISNKTRLEGSLSRYLQENPIGQHFESTGSVSHNGDTVAVVVKKELLIDGQKLTTGSRVILDSAFRFKSYGFITD